MRYAFLEDRALRLAIGAFSVISKIKTTQHYSFCAQLDATSGQRQKVERSRRSLQVKITFASSQDPVIPRQAGFPDLMRAFVAVESLDWFVISQEHSAVSVCLCSPICER
jgi:hypothetical protein